MYIGRPVGSQGRTVMIEVREELQEDIQAVLAVNKRAFGQTAEASIVDALRENCPDLLSLVAVDRGRVVGHILFSPAVSCIMDFMI